LFSSNISLQFQLPEIAEQRSNLQGKAIGLGLQRSHPIIDTAGHRIGGAPVLGQ
jgi:hypothetical protein